MADFNGRKGKPFNGKNTRKNIQFIHETRGKLDKAEKGQQCECLHRAFGHPTLIPLNDGNSDGGSKFRCSLCNKIVSISRIDQDTFNKAFATIDQQCDCAKILARDPDSVAVQAIVQYQKDSLRIKNVLEKIMQANNNSKNRPRREGNSNVTISW